MICFDDALSCHQEIAYFNLDNAIDWFCSVLLSVIDLVESSIPDLVSRGFALGFLPRRLIIIYNSNYYELPFKESIFVQKIYQELLVLVLK